MRRGITRVLYAAAAAGIALTTTGLAGAGTQATAAIRSLSPPVYTTGQAGYVSSGRWFRFVSTTVTIPPRKVPAERGGSMFMTLQNTAQSPWPLAFILVGPGGGSGSVGWSISDETLNTFAMSPKVGDQLRVSIYYDRRGHTEFSAADLTQGITRTARMDTGDIVYNQVLLYGHTTSFLAPVLPPPADVRLWKAASTRVTTYSGVHGTIVGPWTTRKMINTSTGTPAGRVVASPSGSWNGGANFGVWLRALPISYTPAFAGYGAGGSRFRFAATTLTIPSRPAVKGNNSFAYIELSHSGGPTPRPYAYIRVRPGGGTGSVRYDSLYRSGSGLGTLAISPRAGDRLAISVYYDRHSHLRFTATDLTTGASATATTDAALASSSPYNRAGLFAEVNNRQVSTPPAGTRLWQFTSSRITTYSGQHGSTLVPWATSEQIDTTDGTPAGAVVMSPSALSNNGHNFSIWLRHH